MTRPTRGLTRVEITRRVISASRIHTGAASPRTAAAYASIFQRERERNGGVWSATFERLAPS